MDNISNMRDAENEIAQQSLVTFRLDEQIYGLPIEVIVQIIPMVKITPIPQAESVMSGVINVRGEMIPVLNMRQYLGLSVSPFELHTPILLVQYSDRNAGLIVDDVLDVVFLKSDAIIDPANILPEEIADIPLITGLADTENGTVFVLDIANLLLAPRAESLAQAAKTLAKNNGVTLINEPPDKTDEVAHKEMVG